MLSRYRAAIQAANITGLFTHRPILTINNLTARDRHRTITTAVTTANHMLRLGSQEAPRPPMEDNRQKKRRPKGTVLYFFTSNNSMVSQ